ncbi:fucolectin-1-like [Gigantopelta aegis]|uniref:fucolectin-1-like n=1 Tax=Gigantopelta aegis TaxID=1735272 RepID=UPI001B88A1B4|nr:fucolectin-1-like [Gigantopelta aegis]
MMLLSFLLLVMVLLSKVACTPNLALHKTGNQISRWNPTLDMSLALDGRHGTTFGAGDCMITNQINTTKWAQVDLEMSYSIHTVRILNRGDAFPQRLANFSVYVYEEDPIEFPMANKKLCAHYPGTVGAAQWAELSCESHVTGRYVRVSKFNPKPEVLLQICELEVYGERARGSGEYYLEVYGNLAKDRGNIVLEVYEDRAKQR